MYHARNNSKPDLAFIINIWPFGTISLNSKNITDAGAGGEDESRPAEKR